MRCGKRRTRWRPGPALTAQREPPHGVVDAEPNEPAKQEFGLEPLDQPPPLMENLQQHRQQEALGRDRGRVKRLMDLPTDWTDQWSALGLRAPAAP
jgi:hypothetical protein